MTFPDDHVPGTPRVDQHRVLDTRTLVDLVRTGRLVPAGRAGGQPWTPDQQALLFESLESGWPTGQLLTWQPRSDSPDFGYLLDGHRRVTALLHLGDDTAPPLLRDLSTRRPHYLPADRARHDRVYLPVAAMLNTMDFLAATGSLPDGPHHRLAEDAAHRILRVHFDVIALTGGDPSTVAALCARLLPGRVDPQVLTGLKDRG